MPKGLTKLSYKQYKEIQEKLKEPYYGINSTLAREYNVSESTIRNIRNGIYKV